jgi:hypothetical protein
LAAIGVTPVAKGTTPYLDAGALITTLDPAGRFYSHDKIEGVAVLDGGSEIVISNDCDFDLLSATGTGPYQLVPKITTAGVHDDGEFLTIDLTKLPVATSTATVTFHVTPDATSTAVSSSANTSVYGQPVSFTAMVGNASGAGLVPTGSVQFVIDGSNFGTPVALDGAGHAVSAPFTFLAGASQSIRADYSNSDGNFTPGPSGQLTQTVLTVVGEADPLNPSLTDLFVGGTASTHYIDVGLQLDQVVVTLDFASLSTPLAALNALVVYGQAPGILIAVNPNVMLPAFLFAENANAIIQGGGGPTVEVGGSGNNLLLGGTGRDILIAGQGPGVSALVGGSQDNILIGGYSDYDQNLAALMTIMGEWQSSDSYMTRTSVLSAYLNANTVHDDGAADVLAGGGASDWFFAKLDNPNEDILLGVGAGGTVVGIS